ncbi:receptor-interacting serine/threonine-protein kinase 3 isoform X2 [Rana temporaria]|uniref:receptor-interacting serine/threonine-protein kinase 3 isoform X2 n=1 Tax=Rana temporaria TaxID=8407 RepID=UPI001AAD056B|nr:receptor-interacting serine/threonine-protein kinase 3 isoform X2 [Rana temporaria]
MSNIKEISIESLSEWKLIGQGHFGDVYKMKHKELRIPVAVKKLKGNVPHLEELLDEAEKIKHASENYYVIQLFGIVKAPPCIVMEWMECGCLGTLMEKVHEIPWPLKYRFLHEVALGMNWLHRLSPPLLHLDLKPRNVLLNDGLHIKITDFGLSKYTSSSNEANGGTIEYMPPEAFQEGYKPSEASDVYSFAILSAVVLRGDDPYPVQCSSLISVCIPQGQRPSFESLKNINSVKYLEKTIAFTMLCWDNDKRQRPAFVECCNQWEKFITAYKDKDIRDAVKAVQNTMDCTDSTSSRTDVRQSANAPNTKDMSDMIRSMETINIGEHPSAKLEAVPSKNHGSSLRGGYSQRLPSAIQPRTNVVHHGPSTPNYRTGIERNPQSQNRGPFNPNQGQAPQQGQGGFSHRTNSSVYRTGNMRSPQRVQSQFTQPSSGPIYPPGFPPPSFPKLYAAPQGFPPYSGPSNSQPSFFPSNFTVPSPSPTANTGSTNISLNNNEGPCQFGNNNSMVYGTTGPHYHSNFNPRSHPGWTGPTSSPAPTQTLNINISNNSGPLQIGDNNTMYARGSSQYQRQSTRPIPPQPGQTARINTLVPTKSVHNPQPSHTSELCLPTKAGEAFSDAALPTQETERQTEQPLEIPTTKDTTVSHSLQGKDNINSSSSSGEQEKSKQ